MEVNEESLNASNAGDHTDGYIGLLEHWSLFDMKFDKGVDLSL